MTVGVLEVDPEATSSTVNLNVLKAKGPTPIWDTLGLDPPKYLVKFLFPKFGGVVIVLETLAVVLVQGQAVIYPHRYEVACSAPVFEAE